MKILITGANGFIGKNLCEALKNIRDGKDKTKTLSIDAIYCYDIDSTPLHERLRFCFSPCRREPTEGSG